MITLISAFLIGLLLGRALTHKRKKRIYDEAYEAGRRDVMENKKRLIRAAYNIGVARGKDASGPVSE